MHTGYLSRTPRTLSMEQLFLCGASLLHMKSCACFVEEKFAQPEKQFCSTWTFLPVMWSKIGPHDKQLCSTLSVSSRFMLFWHKSPYCHSLRCFDALLILARFTQYCVEQQSTQKSCLCGAKMTNIMYANVLSIKPNIRLGLIADFPFWQDENYHRESKQEDMKNPVPSIWSCETFLQRLFWLKTLHGMLRIGY